MAFLLKLGFAAAVIAAIVFLFISLRNMDRKQKKEEEDEARFISGEAEILEKLSKDSFSVDKKISAAGAFFYVDDKKRQFCIYEKSKLQLTQYFKYGEFQKYNINENNTVGRCKALELHLVINSLQRFNIVLPIISSPVETKTQKYKEALETMRELISTLDYIKANPKKEG